MSEIFEMGVGARGVIEQYIKSPDLTWLRIFCELIDNSLDAKSTLIEVGRMGDLVTIKDDGIGCPDPKQMVSLGGSHEHDRDRSGYFGLGGTISGIRGSRGTRVEYVTTNGGQTHKVLANWAEMIEKNRLFYQGDSRPALPHEKGTIIKIHNAMKFKDTEKVIRDLGFYYADAIKRGVEIRFNVDGKPCTVAAYRHPTFESEVKFKFEFNGFPVHGYCGVVRQGKENPYKGWVIHWGPHRRVLTVRHEPAKNRSVQRIHGHVYLPTDYRNHNMTKDSFAEIPEDLYAMIAEHCTEIIDAGDAASTDFALRSFTESLEVSLNSALPPRVKGRRPGTADKEGTVEPSGSGRTHKEFGPHQPGDKGKPREPSGSGMKSHPYPFKVEWADDLEGPWKIEISQSRQYPSRVWLSRRNAALAGFLERDDPEGLKVVILALIVHHLGRSREQQAYLNIHEEMVAEDMFQLFTAQATAEVAA